MKAFLAVSALVLGFSNLAVAEVANFSAVLHTVQLNGVVQQRNVAAVSLDFKQQTINVSIMDDICGQFSDVPAGQIRCMAAAIPTVQFNIPFKYTSDCGSQVFTAMKDERPVDGALTKVQFTDNSARVCRDLVLGREVLQVSFEGLRGRTTTYVAYNSPEATIDADQAIYEALNVAEVDLNPGIAGSSRMQKSVGRLVCERSMVVIPNAKPSFSCVLSQPGTGDIHAGNKEIYEALTVSEVVLNPGAVGASRKQKSVGSLTCVRSLVIVPNAQPSYYCELVH